jgi:uncharacterized membrane protein (UPF0127 family)
MTQLPLYVRRARTPWQRLRGLLGSAPMSAGHGLLFEGCRAVHTIGMNRPLDLVFLNPEHIIVAVRHALPPYRVAWCWTARAVLELEAGQAQQIGLEPGVRAVWRELFTEVWQ